MPTVLVPLDETAFAETILPDAEQLAGPGGHMVFVYVAGRGEDPSDAERYLTNEAQLLQARGFQVTTKVLSGGDIPRAIDEGVQGLGAEYVAVATHGTEDHLLRGSIAWKTMAHSPVPILLRRAKYTRELDEPVPQPTVIMVPLDGSPRAEQALPVATALATQWQGSLLLAQVGSDAQEAHLYLDRFAQASPAPAQVVVQDGSPGDTLAKIATEHRATHVVMTSHGRSGLSRVIAGDVAAHLIDHVPLPVIVVPALAAAKQPEKHAPEPAPESLPVMLSGVATAAAGASVAPESASRGQTRGDGE
jgi:nucleotide-binding universal stress UspA family protein